MPEQTYQAPQGSAVLMRQLDMALIFNFSQPTVPNSRPGAPQLADPNLIAETIKKHFGL